jgi:hypothetical protein
VRLRAEVLEGAVRFPVRATPRAGRTEIAGLHAGALRVRLAAPPVDGKANAALVRCLARALGVPRSAVSVVRGGSSRDKTVEVAGSPDRILASLLPLSEGG